MSIPLPRTVPEGGRSTTNAPHPWETQSGQPLCPSIDVNGKEMVEAENPERMTKKITTESTCPAPEKIPKSQRRGLLGRFTLVAEVTEPKDYRRATKWYITFVVALAAVAAPMASGIILRWCPIDFQMNAQLIRI